MGRKIPSNILEDIKTFADIFVVSKRTGGNLVQIIRQTTDIIADKTGAPKKQKFSISVPRACYISDAFANFLAALTESPPPITEVAPDAVA